MKIVLFIFVLFVSMLESWTYYLEIENIAPHRSKIFDLSFFKHHDVSGVEYVLFSGLNEQTYSIFFVDKQHGTLHYTPNNYTSSILRKVFHFSVFVKQNHYRYYVPFQVEVSRKDSLSTNTRKEHKTKNFPNHSVALTTNRNLAEKLRSSVFHKCPNLLLPKSLCSCQVSNSTKYLSMQNIVVSQVISDCSNFDVLIPAQEVTFQIKIHGNGLSGVEKLQRRRRGNNKQIEFQLDSYTLHILENKPNNAEVGKVQAYEGGNVAEGVNYGLEAMENIHSLEKFRIDSTGTIFTTAILDRELMSRHQFRVTASRSNANPARTILVIIVDDMNDNSPEFVQQDGYEIKIEENQPLQLPVFRINAYDADVGPNGRVDYSISRTIPSSGSRIFAIMPSGDLVVKENVDREENSQYNLTISATDNGTPTRSNVIHVTINIEDRNDNTPLFTKKKYIVHVKEDVGVGTVIGTVTARDSDAGKNGEVTYSLIQGNRMRKFSLNSKTGEVSIKESLDYEEAYVSTRAKYTLAIRASDGGRPPRANVSGIMEVYLLDVNDNTPQFYSTQYVFDVREDARFNSEIGRVEASDQDHGVNALISYSIVAKQSQSGSQTFQIDRRSGIIKVAGKLDYETKKQYRFTVRASDSGLSRRFVQTEVNINVHDVNDNAPQFSKQQYRVRIAEDTNIGDDILVINATDPDEQTSVGITYQIVSGDQAKKFAILTRNNAGVIKVNKHLDYNEQHLYSLLVRASDGTHSETVVASVVITDTNSHRPVFEQAAYSVSLKEDVPILSEVVQVHANDDDVGENARIMYCFTDNVRNFVINETSGIIRTNTMLDYETNPTIRLTVQARDNGIPQKSEHAEVVIYLQDSNDNPPQFDQIQYHANISEDSRRFTQVLKIHASDKDSGSNARIHYTFDNGNNGNGDFTIERPSGMIRTFHTLDRESIGQYRLVAYAVDGGTPASSTAVTIVINVIDVDDNPPSFENDILTYHVREDIAVGQVIARIQARDPDLQSNSVIKYDLENDPILLRQWFLDPWTGDLKTMHKLDYETKKSYEFTVTASSNSLVNQALVKVLVEDCNDNSPVFNNFEILFNNYRTRTRHSFPHGSIGKVPAYDPDVNDHLSYRILSGNTGNLLILNQTSGDLHLNPSLDSNRQFTVTLHMEVSDGVYHSRANCTLRVTGISDEMLQHSITVRVQHMNDYDFLSPRAMYQFTDGLASVLNTSSNNIFIFNVQNDTDVMMEVLNVSFSARKDGNAFYTSKYLQDQVYLKRQILKTLTGKNVLPFDDNICLREPCLNYKRCTSVLTFDSSAPFISSPTMIFRPIYPVYKLKCECPIGFTNNETCEDEVDLCYSTPCMNGGTCLSREGGYSCICKPRYAGMNCGVNFANALCTQHPNVCANGGLCRDGVPPNHISCDCDAALGLFTSTRDQVSDTCQLLSRQFKHGNFLMLPGITNQWHFSLTISFVTLEDNGLIFYNGRLNHLHDFLALELVDAQVRLNFSSGGSWTVVDPYVEGGLNDGKWHTVEMKYSNEPMSGPLPHGVLDRRGPSSIKVVTLTIDPMTCDDVIASHWNPTYGNYSCSKRVQQTSSKKSLDLTSPLLLGGVPSLPEMYQVRSKTFSGCLGNLTMDGKVVDLAQYIANNGSLPGCPAMQSQCSANKCLGNGTCSPKWNGFHCTCGDSYTGQRCEQRSNFVVDVSGGGCVRYLSPSRISFFQFPWQHQISFRTYDTNAVLLFIIFDQTASSQLTLKIEDGKLVYEMSSVNLNQVVRVDGSHVADGVWHDVMMTWTSRGSMGEVNVTLDHQLTSSSQFSTASLKQMVVTSLYIGGKKVGRGRTVGSFTGCVQNIQFTSEARDNKKVYRLDTNLLKSEDGGSYRRGCKAAGCDKHRCPANSRCVEEWTRYRCKCNTGYVGDRCRSICSLSLCKNKGICRLDIDSPRGYRCACPPGYHGDICEKQYTDSCPSGWYGSGICAPCNCASGMNFDSVCEPKSGRCGCKSHHYKVNGSCVACDCYSVGSQHLQCVDGTGQCQCKTGVLGRQCNACGSKHAEVTTSGCVVNYMKQCPKSWQHDILWPRTGFGKQIPQPCPRGSKGFAFRYCDEKDLWVDADLRNCTSDSYYHIATDLADISSGKAPLITSSIPIAFNLSSVTEDHRIMFDNDLIYATLMVKRLLDYESERTGFDLAASSEGSYTDNLIQTTSRLLSNDLVPYWKRIQASPLRKKESVSSASLLHSWERYVANMLKNFNLIRYNTSVATSSNVDVTMTSVPRHAVTNDGFTLSHPVSDQDDNIRVTLPRYLFVRKSTNHNSSIPDHPTVGMMVYRTMNEILPLSFADDRTFRIPRKPSINSAVVSLQYNWEGRGGKAGGRHVLEQQPVVITFRLNNPRAIAPTCVFWNYTARSTGAVSGGWSHSGCKMVNWNKSHVECWCYHLTTFAVVTDEEVISVASSLSVSVLMGVGVGISILLLFTTVMTSLLLPGVNSVRSVVIRNLSSSLLMADLVYIVGIQQTSSKYGCMAVAVVLHFFLLSTFSWLFIDGLHLYRKLTERRDVNRGQPRVYYVIGWILPAIITALSVGLDAKEFGNNSFCYISANKTLIWSFVGPVLLCGCIEIVLFIMSVHAFLSSKRADMKRAELSFEMKASFSCFPIVIGGWLLAVFALNINNPIYFYLFTLISILQGVSIFLFNCIFNKEMRQAYARYKQKSARKADLNSTRQQLLHSSIRGTTPESSAGALPRFNNSTSESMSMSKIASPMLPPPHESDSDQSCDDTGSDSSMSFGSSSGDEEVEMNTYRNIQNMKPTYQPPQTSRLGNGRLPSNGNSTKAKLSVKKKLVIRARSDESDGSNETAV